MPYCANCDTEVAAGVAACPNCGHPQAPAGYGGLIICPLIPSIIAIVVGNQSKARIASDPLLDGEGMARAGVILGWVGVALGALGIVFAVGAILLSVSTGNFNVDVGP